MCLIAFAIARNRRYPLVLAANRDEFYRRPTLAMDWWQTDQGQALLAGRDQQSGGTWLAVDRSGRVAAVTNVREGSPEPGRVSRGELPLRALSETPAALKQQMVNEPERYAGFNLVSVDSAGGVYLSNRDAHRGRALHRGSYGLSNHLLQSPWPKLLRLRHALDEEIDQASANTEAFHEALLAPLMDRTPAPDDHLPDTGVGLATERFLSSPFIVGDDYGTRATTIVTVSADGEVRVTEQSWGPGGVDAGRRTFHWQR
ncbi:NRDE family protein [Marinobacter sp. C2H3]|uniref:NRDE family protein n=1 Tax=Marinobacter sp. C2H3 TaxID=3119003 RepID=UPI00300F6084